MKMDKERIEKWKCLMCGDRHKKVANISKDGNKTGFSVVCCGCGHIDNYVETHDAIPTFAIGINAGQVVSDVEIVCGCSEYDLSTCTNKTCECRNSQDTGNRIPESQFVSTPKPIGEKELQIHGKPIPRMSEIDPGSMIATRKKPQTNTRLNFSDEEVFRSKRKDYNR